MLSDVTRRIAAALVTLALVFGPGVNSVYASSMGAKMAVAASSDPHSPSNCGDCGAVKANLSGCSVAYCSGVIAFPSVGTVVFDGLPADRLGSYDTRRMTGRVNPPDPYPPKPTILS